MMNTAREYDDHPFYEAPETMSKEEIEEIKRKARKDFEEYNKMLDEKYGIKR